MAYVYADSELESEDSSVPDTGNGGNSNDRDGGHIDPEVEVLGDVSEREDGDEGGSEHSEDFSEEEGRFHTMANHLAKLDGLAVRVSMVLQ